MSEKAYEFWKGTAALILRHLTTMAIIFAAMAAFARPWAEEFIRDTVSQERFATQQSLEGLEGKTEALEARLADMEEEMQSQSRAQTRAERDLEFLKLLQQEQRQDTKRILERLGIQH